MRDQTSYGGEGAVRGTGPLSGSASGLDHHAHRQEVFGEYREEAMDGEIQVEEPEPEDEKEEGLECPECGRNDFSNQRALSAHRARWCGDKGAISGDEARDIYRTYWTTDASQSDLATRHGRSQQSVSEVINRDKQHAGPTRELAKELGHPEERDWPAGHSRKVEVT